MASKETGKEIARIPAADVVREASRLLVEGVADGDAAEDLARRFPGVDAQAALIVVVDQLRQAAACDRQVVVGWAMEAYREIYRETLERGEFGDALKAVDKLVSLARDTENDFCEASNATE